MSIYVKGTKMVRWNVRNRLRQDGIPQGTGEWADYERGKEIVKGMGLSDLDYYSALAMVAVWVGV